MKKKLNKLMAYVLLVGTIINIFPLNVFATYENPEKGEIHNNVISIGDDANEGHVKVNKTITKLDDNGKYRVTFDITGKNNSHIEQKDAKPYILFVVDRSGTMQECTSSSSSGGCSIESDRRYTVAKSNVKSASQTLHNSYPKAMIGAITFSGSTSRDHVIVEEPFAQKALSTNNWTSYGGITPTHEGLNKALEMLSNVSDATSKHIILLSDGIPEGNNTYRYDGRVNQVVVDGEGKSDNDRYITYAINSATSIKNNNIEIYSVFIGSLSTNSLSSSTYPYYSRTSINPHTPKAVMEMLSSGLGYSYDASSATSLSNAFASVTSRIINVEVPGPAGTDVVLNDSIAEDFTYVSDSASSGINVNGKNVTINIPKIESGNTYSYYFDVQIDPYTTTGWHRTNGNGVNNSYSLTGSGIKNLESLNTTDSSEVYWIEPKFKYTIEYYYDNVIDETKTSVFEDYRNTTITLTDEMINDNVKEGFEFIKVVPNNRKINIDINENNNVIKVYYETFKKLSITKKLENTNKNDKQFNFKITIKDSNDNNLNGLFKYKKNNEIFDLQFASDGTANIKLKGSESIEFINLPRNTQYTIVETTTDGYIVEKCISNSCSNGNKITGTLSDDAVIKFINTAQYELPETGSSGMLIIVIMSIAFMLIPVIYKMHNFINSKK